MSHALVVDGVIFNSHKEAVAILDPDRHTQAENERHGHALCGRCNGTGNELYSMYRSCQECGGNGVAVLYGERSPLDRWYFEQREALRRWRVNRRYRVPVSWKDRGRYWLSYWLGVGDWFHDKHDHCFRCKALPSDVDFEMRRVAPGRCECTWGCEAEP